MVKVAKRFVAFFLLAALMAGCATEGGKTAAHAVLTKTPEMEAAFQKGERLYYAKRFAEARQEYKTYLDQFSYNALTAKAYFRLGEISFQEGDLKSAVSFYKKALDRSIDRDWGAYAIYKLAVCYSKQDDPKKVLSTLDRIPVDSKDARVGVKAGSLRVTTAKKLNDPLEERKGYLELIDAYENLDPSEKNVGALTWIVDEKTAQDEIRQWVEKEDSEDVKNIGRYKDWLKRFQGRRQVDTSPGRLQPSIM